MLFHLDDNIRVLAERDDAPNFLVDFTEEIFRARRMGRHIIFAKGATLDALSRLQGLSSRTVQTIKAVKDRMRSKKAFFETVPIFVRVVAEDGVKRRISAGGQDIIEISASFLTNDLFFRETNLLVENQSDGEFYKLITLIYNGHSTENRSVRLNLSIFPGGGSQTPRHYEIFKSESRLTLCIVDGDLEFAGACLGTNTAAPIRNSDLAEPSAFTESIIIECYSIENMIPPDLLRKAHGLEGTEIPWLTNLSNLSTVELWPYLALKQKKKCSVFRGNGQKAVYWQPYKDLFSPKHPGCENWSEQVDCNEPCVVFDGISNKTLEKVVDYLGGLEKKGTLSDLSAVVRELPAPIAAMWKQVAKGVTSWGCSGQRMAVA